jgi:hypothetical protein
MTNAKIQSFYTKGKIFNLISFFFSKLMSLQKILHKNFPRQNKIKEKQTRTLI